MGTALLWTLQVLTYGYCFGVELTVDNNIHTYLHDQFNLSTTSAGNLVRYFFLFETHAIHRLRRQPGARLAFFHIYVPQVRNTPPPPATRCAKLCEDLRES